MNSYRKCNLLLKKNDNGDLKIMGIIDRIAAFPRDLRKRLSYNSNNNNYYSNKLGAYGPLRYRHEGRFSYWEYQKILEDTQVDVAIDVLLKFLLSKKCILKRPLPNP